MKKWFCIFVLFLFAIGCKENCNSSRNTLSVCFNNDPLTLDTRKSGDLISSATIYLLFSGLYELTPQGSLKPALAKDVKIAKDGKTYIFHLRKAFWSDGHRITAQDFEKSWKTILNPDFPALCPHLLFCIKNAEKAYKRQLPLDSIGITVKDDETLIVELEKPTSYFLELVSFCVFFPIPTHIEKNNPSWSLASKDIVSSGPFLLEKWEQNNKLLFTKNPKYWNKGNVHLDHIQVFIVKDENTALKMYENGKIDVLGSTLSPLPFDSIAELKKQNKLKTYPICGTVFCSFNMERFPFNNLNMRKAFSLAIDRENIVKNINQAEERVATRILPPVLMKNENRNLVDNFNLPLAQDYFQKALKELNVKKEDLRLTFTISNGLLQKKQAETLQHEWQKAFGIKINLEQLDEKSIMDRFHRHDYQFGLRLWLAQYFDPMSILERFKYKSQSKNYPNYQDEKYIEILTSISNTKNVDKRKALINSAEEMLAQSIAIAPVYHLSCPTLYQPYVKNFHVGPIGSLHLEKIYLDKE